MLEINAQETQAPESQVALQDLQRIVEQVTAHPKALALFEMIQGLRLIDETSQCYGTIVNGPTPPTIEGFQMQEAKFLEQLGVIVLLPRRRTSHHRGGIIGTAHRQSTATFHDAASLTPLGFQVIDALRAARGQKPFEQAVEEGRFHSNEQVQHLMGGSSILADPSER
ncbi:MAG: hypothetical protein PHS73_00320 [Candidatus Peribacteraceae bacterium]|nr:hypothetical protein [Candidatus Peribacteraceae bacterium]